MEAALQDTKKKQILEFCNLRSQFIDKESLELLEREEHWKEILEQFPETIIVSSRLREKLALHDSKVGRAERETEVKKTRFRAEAKDCSADCRVMKEFEVTNQSNSEGKIGDFLSYFRDKYEFLHSLLHNRPGFSPVTLDRMEKYQQYSEIDVIGMVVRKWVSKNGNLSFELDSPEGSCIAITPKDDAAASREAEKILLDDVIGIKGKKLSEKMMVAKMFLRPDLMQNPPRKAERDLSAMLISDIHVGSRLFLEKEFKKFLSWINGHAVSEKELERMGKIKYLFIAGDNVDGVGIYPDQFDELEIKDVYQQYAKLSEYLKEIPEYIEVFICPGQHDAVRRADPQPAVPQEYFPDLESAKNIHFVGSPGWIEVEGLKCMMYHGASHHDMYAATKHLNPKEPEKAMIELLKKRDLSTGFGLTQPYVPEKRDFMLIREEPDFYFGGDMHHKGYAQYRACMAANAGTWQEQTEYQIRKGHIPTPGIALDINLKTRKLTENNFYSKGR